MKKTTFILYSLFFIPAFAFAQGVNICPSGAKPGECVNNFYTFTLLAGGVLAFGAIVYGGILYTLAAGNPSKQSEGKDWVKSALLGLLLLAGAGLILRTINPNLVDLSLAGLPGLPPGGGEEQLPGLANCSSGGVGGTGTCKNCNNSPAVDSVLNCIRLTSIAAGQVPPTTFQGGHTCNAETGSASCHFGGASCGDGAHAIDWGKNDLASQGLTMPQIISLAQSCGSEKGVPVSCRCEAGQAYGYASVPCDDPSATHVHCNVDQGACSCP